MATLDNVKTLLGIGLTDSSQDGLINLYISRANDLVMNYCNIPDVTSIPSALQSVVEDIAVFKYQGNGNENLSVEMLGTHQSTFINGLPSDIVSQMNKYRRVKVL